MRSALCTGLRRWRKLHLELWGAPAKLDLGGLSIGSDPSALGLAGDQFSALSHAANDSAQSVASFRAAVTQSTASGADLAAGVRGGLIPGFADMSVGIRTLVADMKDLNSQYTAGVDLSLAYATVVGSMNLNSQQPNGSGGGQRPSMNITAPINIPPFDVNAATSQIAAKLGPAVRDAFSLQQRKFDAAITAANVKFGL